MHFRSSTGSKAGDIRPGDGSPVLHSSCGWFDFFSLSDIMYLSSSQQEGCDPSDLADLVNKNDHCPRRSSGRFYLFFLQIITNVITAHSIIETSRKLLYT